MLNNDASPKALSRLELLKLAQSLHVSDADVMTRAELQAAIERAMRPESRPASQPVTWLGVARRLLASIVEQGLHLPDAAALIRGDTSLRPMPSGPPPVATVTLARIYAAQGHVERAVGTLNEVLASDPDHDIARELRAQLAASLPRSAPERRPEASSAATEPDGAAGPAAAEPENAVAPPEAAGDAARAGPATPATEPDGAAAVARTAEPATPEPAATLPGGRERHSTAEPSAAAPERQATASTTEPVAPAASAVAAAPVPPSPSPEAPAVRSPGLVLIETQEPGTYLYWELASPPAEGNGHGGEAHWVCIVLHTPQGAGSQRREWRFPVHHPSGAVRLEGVPRHAVVRAKLTQGNDPDTPPLVVAGSLWATTPAALEAAEARFVPYPGAHAGALARRAADHLAGATPFYC